MNLNHLKRFFISCSKRFKIFDRLSPQENNVLSQANLHTSDFSVNKNLPLIEILKSRSSRMDLLGIPLATLAKVTIRRANFLLFLKT